jgi:hypothetical protein
MVFGTTVGPKLPWTVEAIRAYGSLRPSALAYSLNYTFSNRDFAGFPRTLLVAESRPRPMGVSWLCCSAADDDWAGRQGGHPVPWRGTLGGITWTTY